jgi:hypothetical protein
LIYRGSFSGVRYVNGLAIEVHVLATPHHQTGSDGAP